jgi:hypothetical protein
MELLGWRPTRELGGGERQQLKDLSERLRIHGWRGGYLQARQV